MLSERRPRAPVPEDRELVSVGRIRNILEALHARAGMPSEEQLRHWDRPLEKASGVDAKHPDGGDWGELADLSSSAKSDPYPLFVLPEIARIAIGDYQRYAKQPSALCSSPALAQMGLATQRLADMARDERLLEPISLNQLVVGESGERKSAVEKQFSCAPRAWKNTKRENMLDAHRRSKAMQSESWSGCASC